MPNKPKRDLTRLLDPTPANTSPASLPKAQKTEETEPKTKAPAAKKATKKKSTPPKIIRRSIRFNETTEEHLGRIRRHLMDKGIYNIDNQKTIEIALAVAFQSFSDEEVQSLYEDILSSDSRRKK